MRIVLGLGAVLSALVGSLIGYEGVVNLANQDVGYYDAFLGVVSLGASWFIVAAVLLAAMGIVGAIEAASAPLPPAPVRVPPPPPVPPAQGSDLRIGRHDSWS